MYSNQAQHTNNFFDDHTLFENDDAQKYGILEAIILYKIKNYLKYHKSNNTHFYDGRFWIYNSIKAWQKLIPFCTARQIEHAISKLKKSGVLITGNYNKKGYDKTTWYTINYDAVIPQNCEMDSTNLGNGYHTDVEPIPNIPPINTTKVVEEDSAQELVNNEPQTNAPSSDYKNIKDYCLSNPFYKRLKAIGSIKRLYQHFGTLDVLRLNYDRLFAKYQVRKPWRSNFTEEQQNAWYHDCYEFIENSLIKEMSLSK